MAKKRKTGALYFTDVDLVAKDFAVLTGCYYALEETDDYRTVVISLRGGQWGTLDVSGIAHAVRYAGLNKQGKGLILVLERDRGLYRFTPPEDVHFEKIGDEDREGLLSDLKKIGKSWYTVGGHHQIYREEKGKWKAIDQGVYVEGEKGNVRILQSIDGSSESDIYTVGFNGVIFHYDGTVWRQLDSPTNLGLQRVLCVNKDLVYICGYANGLYRGNTKQWVALTEPDKEVIFWDMAYFQNRLYVCTQNILYVLEDDVLKEVQIPVKGPLGFYRMACNENELWTCGDECVLQYDGKNWKQYVFPDNE